MRIPKFLLFNETNGTRWKTRAIVESTTSIIFFVNPTPLPYFLKKTVDWHIKHKKLVDNPFCFFSLRQMPVRHGDTQLNDASAIGGSHFKVEVFQRNFFTAFW